MQATLPFRTPSLLGPVRELLLAAFGPQRADSRPDPVTQLIKGCLGVRASEDATRIALARLRGAFPDWATMADAPPEAVEPLIAGVADADRKARQLPLLMRTIMRQRGPIYLDFLGYLPVDRAMEWLTALPGVGPAIAAGVLNISTLNRPALVVDGAVHRIAKRLGLVGRTTTPAQTYDALMDVAPKRWLATDFFEFHALLRRVGASHCTAADPGCGRCPLAAICRQVDVGGGQVVAYRRAG
jgi:endonuclease-3